MKNRNKPAFDNTMKPAVTKQTDHAWFNVEQLYLATAIVIIVIGVILGSGTQL